MSDLRSGKATGNPWTRRHPNAWFVGGGFLVLLAVSMASCGRVASYFQRPVVRVGYNRFLPYLDVAPDGSPVGFAAEMLTKAASNAKIDIRWVQIPASADEAFARDNADVFPLMSITPEREARFYMSAPWWENQFALVSTEGHVIADAPGARGKIIATRKGVVQALSQKLFPDAHFVDMLTLGEMEAALCQGSIDGFFADTRLLQGQLMRRSRSCAGQPLHATSVPDSRLYLGTASTKAFSSVNDRLFRELAKLALDGTLSRTASRWGVYLPYDTARLRHAVDAEAHERLLVGILIATFAVLTLSVTQTILIRRAKRAAERAQVQAREVQHRFDEFMKHTPAVTFIKDAGGHLIYSNETEAAGTGPVSRQLCSGDRSVFDLRRSIEVTETLDDGQGNERHFLVLKFPFRGARGATYLGGVALDITARRAAEKELEYHAKRDILTGIANRRFFMAELGSAIEQSMDQGRRLAVGFLDLDGFKEVNDRFGHEAGDELLKKTAARLKQLCHEHDLIARLGGDEFTFFLRERSRTGFHRIVTAFLDAVEQEFEIEGKRIFISASIGVSLLPDHGTTPQQLIRNADSAMYYAKRTGKGRIEFWSRFLAVEAPQAPNRGLHQVSPVKV